MSDATTQHTPADVRERVKEAWATVEAAALAQAARVEEYELANDEAAEIRDAVAQVAALLRTPRGEGEPVAYMVTASRSTPPARTEGAMASGQDVVFRALCRDAGLPEPEVEGEERLEDVLRDDERLRQMLGGIMEVVRQCDEQLDEHGLCQCARYIGQILQRAAEIGTALRRYVEAPEAHICDGGDCGLEPCAEAPAHREPGHARTVRPPRAALRSEVQGEDELAALVVHMWRLKEQRGPLYTESGDFYVDLRRAYQMAAARRGEGGGE